MSFILLLCLVGTYSINNSFLDIYILIGMGVVGYIFRKLRFDMAPLILALVLGPMLEKTFRQSLFLAHGDFWVLFSRPITGFFLLVGLVGIILPLILHLTKSIKYLHQKKAGA